MLLIDFDSQKSKGPFEKPITKAKV